MLAFGSIGRDDTSKSGFAAARLTPVFRLANRYEVTGAAGIAKPNKAALADLTGSILSSLRNH
jgi:hypothetical protein